MLADIPEVPEIHPEFGRDQTISALEFVSHQQTPHTVLLGEPGGGKSTFSNMLALCLAAESLGWKELGLSRLGDGWKAGALLPVRIILREFAVSKIEHDDPAERLWLYFVSTLPSSRREDIGAKLKQHFFDNGGIFILDGYDEAPEADKHRERVKASVAALGEAFPKARVLLTSRVYAYQKPEWRLDESGFENATLAPFTPDQQSAFIDRWYAYCAHVRPNLSEEEAQGRAKLLKDELRERSELAPLGERPLLLTLMASLHASGHGSLPEGREGLYEESVKLLMEQWQRPKMMDDEHGHSRLIEQSAAEFLKVSSKDVYGALERLAFEAHRDQEKQDGEADISLEHLVGALGCIAGDNVQPKQVVAYVRDRAGLLNDAGGDVYRFPHRTFQEYLAARHLTQRGFPDQLVEILHADPERWREAFLLCGAKVAKGTPFAAWTLVEYLITAAETRASDADWQCLSLAGQLLVETGIHGRELNKKQKEICADLREHLGELLDRGELPPVERARAGHWLGLLDDPRPGTGVIDGIPDIDFITVEPPEKGWFWMGEKEADYSGGRRFKCDWITETFGISRYPVTVAQFDAFLSDTSREAMTLPRKFDAPNQPRVNVSWDDAIAFCQWLAEKTNLSVTLPTEAQWEYAARGTDGREYPWGEGWIENGANVGESGIGHTSAVGMFPHDDSWCEGRDMAGNVSEWCLTKWHEEHRKAYTAEDRVAADDAKPPRLLRGGAWYLDPDDARCAYRRGDDPYFRLSYLGFRVCVSPFCQSEL